MERHRPYLWAQGAALLVWSIAWGPGTPEWYDPTFDDPVYTMGVTLVLGLLPAIALGWLCGALQRKRSAAAMPAVIFTTVVALGWASINAFLSGELYFCGPCKGPSGSERIAAAVGMEGLLLVVMAAAAKARSRA